MGVVLLLLLGQGKSLFHKMGNVIRVQMWVDESIFKMRTFSCGCLFFFSLVPRSLQQLQTQYSTNQSLPMFDRKIYHYWSFSLDSNRLICICVCGIRSPEGSMNHFFTLFSICIVALINGRTFWKGHKHLKHVGDCFNFVAFLETLNFIITPLRYCITNNIRSYF